MTDKIKFYFGRLHHERPLGEFTGNENAFKEQLREFCELTDIPVDTEDTWRIGGVEEDGDKIIGKMGRIRTGGGEEPDWDEEEEDFIYRDSENVDFPSL